MISSAIRMGTRILVLIAVLTLIASHASAQDTLTTPTGHEVSVGVASYTYREPGSQAISIHGVKGIADYMGTMSLSKRRRWFLQGQLRGTLGNTRYDGWCSPFLITPDSTSPNGYALRIGNASTCTEAGDIDWYAEGRALVGKDLISERWAWSPFTGAGLRHLSNGITGAPGYRTDDYLYLPLGVTARTEVASRQVLSLTVEADVLLHGWQHTHDSALGGGDVPATPTAPAFTINGFTDVSFSQSRGWALRASAKIPMTPRWSLQPYYVRWEVSSSPVNYETATFTVNTVTAHEQIGAYEPFNITSELGVKLGVRF